MPLSFGNESKFSESLHGFFPPRTFSFLRLSSIALANWRTEYPFTSRYASIDGRQYHYVDEGKGIAPIVCVHGNPTWSFYYRSVIHRFRDQHRVLAVDHLGCGLSEKPQRYEYSLARHTGNLIQWMDQLDLRNVLLVVHDWGGAIGLGAAVARPDRIARILLLNTAAFPPPYMPLRIAACRIPWLGSLAVRGLNAFAYGATYMAIDYLKRLPPNTKAGLLSPYDSFKNRVAIDGFVRDIPMTKSHPTYETLARLEQSLDLLESKPASIVWGMKDWCFRPECLERLERLFPKARVRRLEEVGHYVMEEAPQAVAEEIALLQASADR